MRRIKILLAKPGLDGHDVGVKVLAHSLKDAGFEVVYSGLRKSIEEIAEIMEQEKADIAGLSILSGTHKILCEKMKEELEKKNLNTPWIVGGNIPLRDVEPLKKMGAKEVFPTGTTIDQVVGYFKTLEKESELWEERQ